MAFSDKVPAEEEYFGFDFLPRLAQGEVIQGVTFAVDVVSGVDPDAPAMLQGAPSIKGGIVKQLLRGGLAGVQYRLRATAATSSGQTLVEAAMLRVRETI